MKDRIVVSISLPRKTAKELDRTRKKLGLTRSEFFRIMIRQQLGQEVDLAALAERGEAFDFLKDEPDIYSPKDTDEQR